jgi:hypothetical protein
MWLPQSVAFAVIRSFLAIRTPILGMLVLPAVLAVSLVGPVIGISSHCGALPLGFSGPLAGLVGADTLRLDPGIRQHETPAMGPANGAVHGCLLHEAGHHNTRLSQEE